ncbi:hypothetical protein G9464_02980 [Halostella sp. JP-L12]|uniref:hypothetical protein n=1 Tax=Halostella TaxID=1843185 RepID=UPI000EF7DBDA|nr:MULTISPECIES: hypothetical protein [Halostella]NHN46562.1 hypothetical protein [Halostella sp. JP-L12]
MTFANSLRKVADVVEAVESIEGEDIGVAIDEGEVLTDSTMAVGLDIQIPLAVEDREDIQIRTQDAHVSGEGIDLQLAIETETEGCADSTTGSDSDTGTKDDPIVEAESDYKENGKDRDAVGEEESPNASGTVAEDTDDHSNGRDLPPYRDPDTLEDVYDECDTFTEMRDALDVEVTPQTVRKYMIEHDIHEPSPTQSSQLAAVSSSEINTANEDSSRKEQTADSEERDEGDTTEEPIADEGDSGAEQKSSPDGMTEADQFDEEDLDLPGSVTIEEIKEAVRTSRTLYEIQNKLGVSRDRARGLLEELDLLEFVHGRISSVSEKNPSAEEINERIRTASLQERAK